MMRKSIYAATLLTGVVLFSGCSNGEETTSDAAESTEVTEVTVSAAASLQNAFGDIETTYESEHEDVDLVFNFGGSGTLATQIQEGAPADIFFSASQKNYDVLDEDGLIQEGIPLLENSLVLITNKENPVNSVEEASTIAIGTPDAVPAGTYAKQTLEAQGLWDTLQPNIVQTKDVTEVLTSVETGNADVGYVYNTDAISSDTIEVVSTVDSSLHDAIVYPVGLLTDNEEAKEFYDYLQTDEAIDIFEDYGFIGNNE